MFIHFPLIHPEVFTIFIHFPWDFPSDFHPVSPEKTHQGATAAAAPARLLRFVRAIALRIPRKNGDFHCGWWMGDELVGEI